MGELHSIAQSGSAGNIIHASSLGWDPQNLGVLNADMSFAVMDENSPIFSSLESDFSSGYLEDALLEFGDRCKRRRLLLYTDDDDDQTRLADDHVKNYWPNSNCDWEMSENFSYMSHISSIHGISEEHISSSTSNISEEFANVKTPEDISTSDDQILDHLSTSSSDKHSAKAKSLFERETTTHLYSGGQDYTDRKKRVITRVVYPFALVKPGGVEGDLTINDINQRILMPPTRPVRHPVGDFACRPVVSADGPGLSGKAVVALTKIQTQGRGTITIIRTKG